MLHAYTFINFVGTAYIRSLWPSGGCCCDWCEKDSDYTIFHSGILVITSRFNIAEHCCLLQFKNHLKTAVDILYANPSAETFSMEPLATIQPNELYSIPIDKAQSYDYYIRRNGFG